MLAIGDRSKEKLPSLGPSALASGHVCLPAASAFGPLPLSRGGQSTTPLAPFPAWKPEPLLQLGDHESCAGPWLGGKNRMGRLAAGRVRRWQGCMCCAIVCCLSGSCKNKCLEFDSVCQDPLSFLHLDFLNRSCFSLD